MLPQLNGDNKMRVHWNMSSLLRNREYVGVTLFPFGNSEAATRLLIWIYYDFLFYYYLCYLPKSQIQWPMVSVLLLLRSWCYIQHHHYKIWIVISFTLSDPMWSPTASHPREHWKTRPYRAETRFCVWGGVSLRGSGPSPLCFPRKCQSGVV